MHGGENYVHVRAMSRIRGIRTYPDILKGTRSIKYSLGHIAEVLHRGRGDLVRLVSRAPNRSHCSY
jgi:hypothetical protein